MEIKRSPAFVTGATGFTGREVVRLLRDKGVPTVAHVRPDSPRLEEWRQRFEGLGAQVDTSPWDKDAMAMALKNLGPAYVFALLGTVRARMKQAKKEGRDPKSESYEAVDCGLTLVLMQAAQACGSKPKFIYLSAAGVAGGSRSDYYKARAKVERELLASELAYCIARPSFIIGPDRDVPRPLEGIGAAVADGFFSVAGLVGAKRFRDRYSSMTNTILAEALVGMALDPEAGNKIFESEALRQGKEISGK